MADTLKVPDLYEVVRVAYDSKGNALCAEDEQAEIGHVDVVYEPRLFETFRTRGSKKDAVRACRRHRDAIIAAYRAQEINGNVANERCDCCGGAMVTECCKCGNDAGEYE